MPRNGTDIFVWAQRIILKVQSLDLTVTPKLDSFSSSNQSARERDLILKLRELV